VSGLVKLVIIFLIERFVRVGGTINHSPAILIDRRNAASRESLINITINS
jgi:hypothetical protein